MGLGLLFRICCSKSSLRKKFDKDIREECYQELHRQFQQWIAAHPENCEVVVHGWNHRNPDYLTNGAWESMPGVDYSKRSEWYRHPAPEENYNRCVKTLEGLGYSVKTSTFSSPGGRADVSTLKALRNSNAVRAGAHRRSLTASRARAIARAKCVSIRLPSAYKVIEKIATQPANFPPDYGVESDLKPLYLEQIDFFVFPWHVTPGTSLERIEELIAQQIPIYYANHGYEPCVPWETDLRTIEMFKFLHEKYSDQLIYLTANEYTDFLYEQLHG